MGWCEKFKESVKQKMNIKYQDFDWEGWDGKGSPKGWYFNTCDDSQFEINISYCPYCGAKLTEEDI